MCAERNPRPHLVRDADRVAGTTVPEIFTKCESRIGEADRVNQQIGRISATHSRAVQWLAVAHRASPSQTPGLSLGLNEAHAKRGTSPRCTREELRLRQSVASVLPLVHGPGGAGIPVTLTVTLYSRGHEP